MGQMATEFKQEGAMLDGKCLCGQVTWRYHGMPARATVCNCNACRRFGAIWIYGNLGEEIEITGKTHGYVRADADGDLAFHTCPNCGALHSWQPADPKAKTGYRLAVNLRLGDPSKVAEIAVRRFDGWRSWSDLTDTGRCVGDYII